MKTIEKELKKFNFPEILVDLHRNRKTGTLTVFTGDVTRKVFFDKGNAIFSSSTDEEERLGEMLIKLGKITIEQYDKSVELLKETGKRQGTILVELGYLTPKDLVLGVKSQVREIIYNLFQVEFAEYEFEEGPLPNREVITLQMSMGNLIYEGMKRMNNVVRMKRDMPDMDSVLVVNEEVEGCFRDIVLSPRDKAMLAAIDGSKTIRELVDSTPSATFEAMKTLYILYITGLVTVQEKQQVAEDHHPSLHGETEVSPSGADEVFHRRVNELFGNLYRLRPHELLGIDRTSDAKAVQDNYFKLVNEFHPDRAISSSDPIMTDKLITISEEIQKAYALLKEDDGRKSYFLNVGDPLLEITRHTYDEEAFKTELTKVSEDILSLREDADREPEKEEEHATESLNGISFRESSGIADYNSFEEKHDGFTEPSGDYVYIVDEDDEDRRDMTGHREADAAGAVSHEVPSSLDNTLEMSDAEQSEPVEETAEAGQDLLMAVIEDVIRTEDAERGEDEGTIGYERAEEPHSDSFVSGSHSELVGSGESPETAETDEQPQGFGIDELDLAGEMFFGINISVIDMSVHGIAIEVDRQLSVGKVYLMNFYDGDKTISVRAEVMRSQPVEPEAGSSIDDAMRFTVGMEFRDMTANLMQDIASFINKHKVDEKKMASYCMLNGIRVNDRLQIDPGEKNVLDLMKPCRVKAVSLSGMLIESEEDIGLYETVRINVSLRRGETISFMGSTISCTAAGRDPERYRIEIEVTDMSAADREKLKAFLMGISDSIPSGTSVAESEVGNEEPLEESQEQTTEAAVQPVAEKYEQAPEAYDKSLGQDVVNQGLVELISEIKVLLSEIRSELSVISAQRKTLVDSGSSLREVESIELAHDHAPEVQQEVVDDEPADIPKKSEQLTESVVDFLHEQDQEVSHVQDKPEPTIGESAQGKTASRKKLKTWHMMVPSLFLIAALASFLIISTPQKEKIVSQQPQNGEARKEVAQPVQKNQEQQRVATQDTKKLTPPPAVQKAPHTLELIASDATWLSATIDDKTTKEMLMKPGDRVTWTAKNGISLVIGNAAGVQVRFDGKEITMPGGKGKVVRLQLPMAKSS